MAKVMLFMLCGVCAKQNSCVTGIMKVPANACRKYAACRRCRESGWSWSCDEFVELVYMQSMNRFEVTWLVVSITRKIAHVVTQAKQPIPIFSAYWDGVGGKKEKQHRCEWELLSLYPHWLQSLGLWTSRPYTCVYSGWDQAKHSFDILHLSSVKGPPNFSFPISSREGGYSCQ